MTQASYWRQIGTQGRAFGPNVTIPSHTGRHYKYKNKDTKLRLRNTVEIKTTTSPTTVDWDNTPTRKQQQQCTKFHQTSKRQVHINKSTDKQTLSYQIVVSNLVTDSRAT